MVGGFFCYSSGENIYRLGAYRLTNVKGSTTTKWQMWRHLLQYFFLFCNSLFKKPQFETSSTFWRYGTLTKKRQEYATRIWMLLFY
jgi:hypothetical protein